MLATIIIRTILIISLPFIMLCAIPLSAQTQHDSKGKEFWVTFLANENSDLSQLRLYISSSVATKVRITYTKTKKSIIADIPTPNIPVEFNIKDFDDGAILNDVTATFNEISNKSFHIVANDDITLYGANIAPYTVDAFICLPDDAMTRDYYITSYNSNIFRENTLSNKTEFLGSSQFAIIATEDWTNVRVFPTSPSTRRSKDPFSITLQKGQVFFAQAKDTQNVIVDFTGTRVVANKPIVVFSGNKCEKIPKSAPCCCDHLVEQVPPIQSWGTTAFLTPHYNIIPQSPYADSSVATVIAALDDTQCTLTTDTGSTSFLLNAGQVKQILPLKAATISATGPILVTQFEHSIGITGDTSVSKAAGDPFMMIIPPKEQYDTAYSFQSISYFQFKHHFINVVIAQEAIPSLRLNGNPVNATFLPIPGSSYYYAQIKLQAGAHHIRSDSAFGLYAYGYGSAVSYGYTGGTLFRNFAVDFERPVISAATSCSIINGLIIDDHVTDTGIDSCYIVPTNTVNATVTISSFISGADTIRYSAQLNDPYQDGSISIKAVDGAGRSTTHQQDIQGYTLRAINMIGNTPQSETLTVINGTPQCRDIEIVNYGKFSQNISHFSVSPSLPGIIVTPDSNIIIAPNERKIISVCYEANSDTVLDVALGIGNSCTERTIVALSVQSILDTIPPMPYAIIAQCQQGIDVEFRERLSQFHTIRSAKIIELNNATISFEPSLSQLPQQQLTMNIVSIDPRQDIIYAVEVTDQSGNIVVVRDTIGGFTLSVLQPNTGRQLSAELGVAWLTDSLALHGGRCDSVTLTNYGNRALLINKVRLSQNQHFSIPPAQFPMVVPPKDSIRLSICLFGQTVGNHVDTLELIDTCGQTEKVALKTSVGYGQGFGSDQCGQQLSVQAYAPAKRTYLTTPFPNPAIQESVTVDIGLQQNDIVTIRVYDLQGNIMLSILEDMPLQAGVHRLQFEHRGLTAGTYICRMTTRSQNHLTKKFIVAQ